MAALKAKFVPSRTQRQGLNDAETERCLAVLEFLSRN